MHNDPLAWCSTLVARSMRDVLWHIDLIPGLDCQAVLKPVAIVHRAFAFQEISNCLDALVVMDLCLGAGRHRQHVQTDLFCSDCFRRYASLVSEALLADVGSTGLNHSH